MRAIKTLELVIVSIGAWALFTKTVPVLLLCIFLLGLHSTLFGPVKYAYLPQHLRTDELTGGNGMVEMGTFVSILLGNILGGILIAIPEHGAEYVAWACLAFAAAGRLMAQALPPTPASDPTLRINWNPFTETWRNLVIAHQSLAVFRSLLGISWMWFVGAVFLGNFPAFAKEVLHGDPHVASLLLVVFSVGVAIGSLLCETLSRRMVEIGLVPLGCLGMTVFAVDLYFACMALGPHTGPAYGLAAFWAAPGHARVLFDLGMLALSAGLYSVPMYALIQMRSTPTHRARIIAANNILNALFMVVSAVLAGALLSAGAGIAQVFLWLGLANAVFTLALFLWAPQYLRRLRDWLGRPFG
jgi:MFS family permease